MSGYVQGKSVYLSGPITGREFYNRPAFNTAERLMRKMGATHVFNPTALSPKWGEKELPRAWYMQRCLSTLASKRGWDCLVLLDGWESSIGASVEAVVARALDMEIYTLRQGEKQR